MAGPATYVLVNENDADVLPVRRKPVKGRFDGRVVCLAVHHQKVLLRIGSRRHMLQVVR